MKKNRNIQSLGLSLALLPFLLAGLAVPSQAQDLDDLLERASLTVYAGPNASFGIGERAQALQEDIQAFREQDFSRNSSFVYIEKGEVDGTAGVRPVVGFQAGANLGFALTEQIELQAGLSLRRGGYRWFLEETYTDSEFQYDQELSYREKVSYLAWEVPIQALFQWGEGGGGLFLGGGLGQLSRGRQVVRDDDLVWINNRQEDVLTSKEKETETYQNLDRSYFFALGGVAFPIGENLQLRLEGQVTTSNLLFDRGNASAGFSVAYRLSGEDL